MSQATTVPKKRYVYRIPSFQTSCYLESNDSAASGSSNSSNRRYPLDSSVFALFLEPAEEVQSTYVKPKSTNTGLVTNNKEQEEEEDQIGLFAKLINFGVGFLQPSPAMQHVELVVPSSFYKTPVNFAIYYNMKSSWCGNRSINQSYYMEEHAYQWRALPVQFDNASSEVRRACNLNDNTVYSVAKYFTSIPPLRGISRLIPEGNNYSAHCAVLTARVLRNSCRGMLKHNSLWYGPATLYREMCDNIMYMGNRCKNVDMSFVMNQDVQSKKQVLLTHSDRYVKLKLTELDCQKIIKYMTSETVLATMIGVNPSSVTHQKQLATALLRWSILFHSDS